MKAHSRLYDALPVFAQNMVVAHYGRKLHRMRFGGVHEEQYREIVAFEGLSESERRRAIVDKLRAILLEAAENTPHYRPQAERLRKLARSMRDPSEIGGLPLLEKATVNADPQAFYSLRPAGERIFGNTSGTSGRPIRTMKTPESYQRNWAFLRRVKESHGIRMGMRRASFGLRQLVPARQRRPPFWRFEPAERNYYFSIYHLSGEFLEHYHAKLAEWRPEEIVSYPSSLAVLADHMLERGVRLEGERVAFMQAETLFDWQRDRIERALGARVVNIYGLAENAAWIYECTAGMLHVRPDYGHTELIPIEDAAVAGEEAGAGGARGGTLCEIVSTGLINRAMPLIRYRTGDTVLVGGEDHVPRQCGCGVSFPTVSAVIGRMDDYLVSRDGRVMTRLDGVFKGIAGVREAQIEQVALDKLIVRVVPKPGLDPSSTEEVVRRLQRIFDRSTEVEIHRVERLPLTRAGKVRYTINSLAGESMSPYRSRAFGDVAR